MGMMVGCDTCSEWFHPVCVGLSDKEARELKSFKCPLCKEKKKAEKVAPQKQSTVVKKEGNQEGTMKNVVMKRKKDTQVRKEAVHTPVNTKDQEHKPKTKDVAKPVRVIGRAKRASLTVNDPKVKFAV